MKIEQDAIWARRRCQGEAFLDRPGEKNLEARPLRASADDLLESDFVFYDENESFFARHALLRSFGRRPFDSRDGRKR